jgi:hypothetical protein
MLASKPCSEATNIEDSFSSGANFGYWSISRIHIEEI